MQVNLKSCKCFGVNTSSYSMFQDLLSSTKKLIGQTHNIAFSYSIGMTLHSQVISCYKGKVLVKFDCSHCTTFEIMNW